MNANIKIGFVGGGNMATALIEGILKKKLFAPSQVGVFEPDAVRAKKLQKYKISLFPSNALLAAASPVLLLAIKPQQVGLVLENIAPLIGPKHLILSILAGIDTETFYKKLPRTTRLIRIMPNLCAQIAEGASALYASKTATAADRSLALKLLKAVGTALFVETEEQLDAVTALSGSGPAFVYLFAKEMIEAGEKQGLPKEVATQLFKQTLLGSAKMVSQSQEPLTTLMERVASKGGTTEAGLKVLEERGLKGILEKTISAATQRARELR